MASPFYNQITQFISHWLRNFALEKHCRDAKRMKEIISLDETLDHSKRLWLWVTLLAVLTIAAMFTYYFQINEKPAPEKLYLAYYEPYPNDIDPITKSASSNRSAYQLYEVGDYESAIASLIPNLSDKHARWYFAQSMLAKDDLPAARDIMEQFVRSRDEDYTIHSTWYLALINLNEENIEAAKTQLNTLSESNHQVYKRKAVELLAKID